MYRYIFAHMHDYDHPATISGVISSPLLVADHALVDNLTANSRDGLAVWNRQNQEQAQRVFHERAVMQTYDLQRRTLASNQHCYGGVVIEQSGSTYTQLGTIGAPIHCSGSLADRPLR
ncbi:MAG: hypothetical protein ACREPQ_15695 [Rhodanobacter sp.]